MKNIKRLDTAYSQYQTVTNIIRSTIGIQENKHFFRRRVDLLSVMQFILSESDLSN